MKIIIAGAGEVGSHLAKMLSNESNDITVIDSEKERLDMLSENADVITVEGNICRTKTNIFSPKWASTSSFIPKR